MPVARLMVRFIRLTCLFVQGCLTLVRQMLDTVFSVTYIEHARHIPCCGSIGVSRRNSELNTIVCQNGVDYVGGGFDRSLEENRRRTPPGFLNTLDEGKFGRAVDSNIEKEFALRLCAGSAMSIWT